MRDYLKTTCKGALMCFILTLITSLLFKGCVNRVVIVFLLVVGATTFIIDTVKINKMKNYNRGLFKDEEKIKDYINMLNEHININIVMFFFIFIVLFLFSGLVYKIWFFNVTHFTMFMMIYFVLYVYINHKHINEYITTLSEKTNREDEE